MIRIANPRLKPGSETQNPLKPGSSLSALQRNFGYQALISISAGSETQNPLKPGSSLSALQRSFGYQALISISASF